ncbi:MAG: ATP-binding protein [Nitrospinae bacterium]|nr:ATP-binding protein [Nitrospinota bacterium]
METATRYLAAQTKEDLKKKMVFLCGPRQVGKTTMAKSLLSRQSKGYLNWDIPHDREKILKRELPAVDFWVFDEIHKYKGWRNYLKGIYDQFERKKKILVTGSAQLDYYRRGGDSLQGRYHFLRLHPLSVAELGIASQKDFMELLTLGGFPEPFFSSSAVESKRWSMEYRSRLIAEDIVSLENISDLGNLELLLINLPRYVSSPLSLNSLREDLQVAHKTVSKWLQIFERLYAIFRLSPFGAKGLRAIKKGQKHYHFDWTLVKDDGPRFENMVALHLLKWAHYMQDTRGREVEVKYFRDIDGREVDFVVEEEGRPATFIECKWSDAEISNGLRYMKNKFPDADFYQISAAGQKDYLSAENIRVCPAVLYLKGLV